MGRVLPIHIAKKIIGVNGYLSRRQKLLISQEPLATSGVSLGFHQTLVEKSWSTKANINVNQRDGGGRVWCWQRCYLA